MADFGWAIRRMKDDKVSVSREGWNGRGMYLRYVPETVDRDMAPFIVMFPVHGSPVPWLASQTDMLADDWQDGPS